MGSCFEERSSLTKERRNKGNNNNTNTEKINIESTLNESQNENTGINEEKYKKICIIGETTLGQIVKIQSILNKENYALKIIQIGDDKRKIKCAINEYSVLKECHHPNILFQKEIFKEKKNNLYTLNIILEFANNGNIQQKLNENIIKNKNFDEKLLIYWLIQICLALSYLNKKHIIHRNIKPSNLYLTESGLVKIGGFGYSKKFETKDDLKKQNSLVGTELYMSPEMKSTRIYNEKTDIYSLGKTFYQLIYSINISKDSETYYSSNFLDLIKTLLNENISDRPSPEEILENVIIKDKMREFLEENKFEKSLAYTIMERIDNKEKLSLNKNINKDVNEDSFIRSFQNEWNNLNEENNKNIIIQNNKNEYKDLDVLMSIIYKKLKNKNN